MQKHNAKLTPMAPNTFGLYVDGSIFTGLTDAQRATENAYIQQITDLGATKGTGVDFFFSLITKEFDSGTFALLTFSRTRESSKRRGGSKYTVRNKFRP
jgi:hypothetical protein